MIIQIQSQSALIQKILKHQKIQEGVSYRHPSWILEHTYVSKKYLFNVLTKELLRVDTLDDIDNKELIKRWFLVPETFNDYDFISEIKRLLRFLHKHKGIVNYTIFTTIQCNANCNYCFENRMHNDKLTNSQGKHIIDFISRHSNSRAVMLHWFGGEPILNPSIIDKICSGLRERQVDYTSIMTSNGFLFNESIIKRAICLWNLSKVQITLDGLFEMYNEIKRFKTKDRNPFNRVISNIDDLSKAGVRVMIRLNLSLENGKELEDLVDYLALKFHLRKNINIYVSPIFELLTEENGNMLLYHLNKIQDKIEYHNFGTNYENFSTNRINHCKADNNGQSIVIFPDGSIGWCEHMWKRHSVCNIENVELSLPFYEDRWNEYNIFNSCKNCVLYADCLKLSKCDVNNVCIPELKDFDIRKIKDTINKTISKHEIKI